MKWILDNVSKIPIVVAGIAVIAAGVMLMMLRNANLEKELITRNLETYLAENNKLVEQRKDDIEVLNAAEANRKEAADKIKELENEKRKLANRLKLPATRVVLNSGICSDKLPEASNSGASVGESRAYISNESFKRIYDIGVEGDRLGHRLNYCIDQYNYIKDKYGFAGENGITVPQP